MGLHRAFGVSHALDLEGIDHVANLLELVVGEFDLAGIDALLDALRVGLEMRDLKLVVVWDLGATREDLRNLGAGSHLPTAKLPRQWRAGRP